MASEIADGSGMKPRARRGLRVALLVSLALNMLFIGGLVSAFMRHGGPPGMGAPGAQMNLGAFVQTLPKERGPALWRSTAEKRRALGPMRQQVRHARRETLTALTSDPFDHESYRAAQTRLIEAETRQRMAMRDILVDIAGSMTPDERRAYIRWRGPPRPSTFGDDEDAGQPPQKK